MNQLVTPTDSTASQREAAILARLTWVGCAAAFAGMLALLFIKHMTLAPRSILLVALLDGLLIVLAVVYTFVRPVERIGLVASGMVAFFSSGVFSAVSALAALRAGPDLYDARLARLDALMGFDAVALITWVAHHHIVGMVLYLVYGSTVPMVVLAIVTLGLLRRVAAMWRLCFMCVTCSTLFTWISGAMPAIAAFTYYKVPADLLRMLPAGSGVFFVPVFMAFRLGKISVIDIDHFEGVVTFPSFHAAMALMVGYSLCRLPGAFVPAWIWAGLVLLSTLPIGGHYAVDLLGGGVLWLGTYYVATRVRSHAAHASGGFENALTVEP